MDGKSDIRKMKANSGVAKDTGPSGVLGRV